MKIYEKVLTNVEVEPLQITDYNVYVRSNITPVEQENLKGYEYTETEYTKDEYIALQAQQLNELNVAIDDMLVLIPAIAGGAENV